LVASNRPKILCISGWVGEDLVAEMVPRSVSGEEDVLVGSVEASGHGSEDVLVVLLDSLLFFSNAFA
jgi:hypothetical protein